MAFNYTVYVHFKRLRVSKFPSSNEYSHSWKKKQTSVPISINVRNVDRITVALNRISIRDFVKTVMNTKIPLMIT